MPLWRVVLVGRRPKWTVARIIALTLACFLARCFVVLPIRVEGISMLPTYREHKINLVNRLAYVFHGPHRGDVVAIRLMAGEHIMYMKRVVGLPGETVGFHQGRLMVNGQPMDEPYMRGTCDWELPPEKVGPDEYYVVGDNRSMAEADHTKGRVPLRRIIGKVLL